MRGEEIERARRICKLNCIPTIKFVRIGARCDQLRRRIDGMNRLAEGCCAGGELLACGVSKIPVAPKFVAELPLEPRMCRPMIVDVANPVSGLLRRPAAEIQGNLRLSANLAAVLQKLVRAESVVLGNTPGVIEGVHALVARAHAVRPLIGRGEG